MEETSILDPETEFLTSKRETNNEWELFKENVRPLKRGRNIQLLNQSLKSQTDNHLKKTLLDHRRKLIEGIDEYRGDDPLKPWIECIKWVQEAFPPGGDSSGLIMIYEQCVRSFWHDDRYKEDLRYLKVWIEYAENCLDAEVIYSFLEANNIGQTHSMFYISYALFMESKNKIRTANEIFEKGISRDSQPILKLKNAYKKFFTRSITRSNAPNEEEDVGENPLTVRSFGTLLTKDTKRMGKSDLSKNKANQDRPPKAGFTILKDSTNFPSGHATTQTDLPKTDLKSSWPTLGARAERNKENNAIPAKWKSIKIPQTMGRTGGRTASASSIEVFVDEECAGSYDKEVVGNNKKRKTFGWQLRNGDIHELKKETVLLRENPLRNFPMESLPR